MSPKKLPKQKKDKPTIDKAFKELEKITESLEKENIDLEKSIPQLKRGHELAAFLKKRLQEIENEIEEIKVSG